MIRFIGDTVTNCYVLPIQSTTGLNFQLWLGRGNYLLQACNGNIFFTDVQIDTSKLHYANYPNFNDYMQSTYCYEYLCNLNICIRGRYVQEIYKPIIEFNIAYWNEEDMFHLVLEKPELIAFHNFVYLLHAAVFWPSKILGCSFSSHSFKEWAVRSSSN